MFMLHCNRIINFMKFVEGSEISTGFRSMHLDSQNIFYKPLPAKATDLHY